MIEHILCEAIEINKLVGPDDIDIDLERFRAIKNRKLRYPSPTFQRFAAQAAYGDYPDDGPDFRTDEQQALDEEKEAYFREAIARQGAEPSDTSDEEPKPMVVPSTGAPTKRSRLH